MIMISCALKQIHRVKHTIPITIKTQKHRYNELVYFISGNGTTEIDGQVYPYKAGDFAFYKMGTPHNECDPEPCDIIWLHFSFDIDNIELKEGVFHDFDGALLSLLKRLRKISLEQKKHSEILLETCLAEIVATVSEKQEESEHGFKKISFDKIINYIDQNINEQIDFKLLAQNNHYSYDRFRHIFSEQFGVSPYAYLINQRIEHAKRLLKNSDSSITDIAFDCGFNSSSQFTNIFKKYVLITPKEYRKKN